MMVRIVALFLLLAACDTCVGPAPRCVEGSTNLCFCSPRQAGVQRCNGAGAFGECSCEEQRPLGEVATGELTDGDVRQVIQRGQRALQACYEEAIRGSSPAPTVRLEIELTVVPSGEVSSVKIEGGDEGTLKECAEERVRAWRFPSSRTGAVVPFPVIFQGR